MKLPIIKALQHHKADVIAVFAQDPRESSHMDLVQAMTDSDLDYARPPYALHSRVELAALFFQVRDTLNHWGYAQEAEQFEQALDLTLKNQIAEHMVENWSEREGFTRVLDLVQQFLELRPEAPVWKPVKPANLSDEAWKEVQQYLKKENDTLKTKPPKGSFEDSVQKNWASIVSDQEQTVLDVDAWVNELLSDHQKRNTYGKTLLMSTPKAMKKALLWVWGMQLQENPSNPTGFDGIIDALLEHSNDSAVSDNLTCLKTHLKTVPQLEELINLEAISPKLKQWFEQYDVFGEHFALRLNDWDTVCLGLKIQKSVETENKGQAMNRFDVEALFEHNQLGVASNRLLLIPLMEKEQNRVLEMIVRQNSEENAASDEVRLKMFQQTIPKREQQKPGPLRVLKLVSEQDDDRILQLSGFEKVIFENLSDPHFLQISDVRKSASVPYSPEQVAAAAQSLWIKSKITQSIEEEEESEEEQTQGPNVSTEKRKPKRL